MKRVIIFIILCTACSTFIGCAGPDSMRIGYNQAEYKADADAYRGFGVSFQWDLK